MNTIRSTWVGLAGLLVAGSGTYYFAKKQINADRSSRYEAEKQRKAQLAAAEAAHRSQTKSAHEPPAHLKHANLSRSQNAADDVASPSEEAGHDPAPTRHEPETEEERLVEKGKYEATRPFRPPSGNRFS